jgi:hypothetical protein
VNIAVKTRYITASEEIGERAEGRVKGRSKWSRQGIGGKESIVASLAALILRGKHEI